MGGGFGISCAGVCFVFYNELADKRKSERKRARRGHGKVIGRKKREERQEGEKRKRCRKEGKVG